MPALEAARHTNHQCADAVGAVLAVELIGHEGLRVVGFDVPALVAEVGGEADLDLADECFGVNAVALLPDGTRGLSASVDETVRLWDLNSGTELAELRGHEGPVLAVAVSPDGALAASAGVDGTVNLWNIEERRIIASLYGTLYVLLKLEAFALLVGTAVLFIGLFALMYTTRTLGETPTEEIAETSK